MKSLMQRLFARRAALGLSTFHHAAAAPLRFNSRVSLVRTFVETGDQRCPLAGLWSGVAETVALADEPESTWPVLRWLLSPGRAVNLRFNPICYV